MHTLNILEQQILFLIKKHKEYQAESMKTLAGFSTQLKAHEETDMELEDKGVLQDIIRLFDERLVALDKELELDAQGLQEQLSAINQIKIIDDVQRRKELTDMLVEDLGSELVDEVEEFKKTTEKFAREELALLRDMVKDFTQALNDGGIREVEALLSEFLDQSNDNYDHDEADDVDEDLSDEDIAQIKEAFMQVNRPYFDGDKDDAVN